MIVTLVASAPLPTVPTRPPTVLAVRLPSPAAEPTVPAAFTPSITHVPVIDSAKAPLLAMFLPVMSTEFSVRFLTVISPPPVVRVLNRGAFRPVIVLLLPSNDLVRGALTQALSAGIVTSVISL